jgi:hypothetical protein
VDAALMYAADNMPEEFCTCFDHLKHSAKFIVKQQGKDMVDGAQPAVPARASRGMSGMLRVCTKCAERLKKKGVDFDPVAAVKELIAAETDTGGKKLHVMPTGCMRHCKLGGCAALMGSGPAIEGMTEEENAKGCFLGMEDKASTSRVVKLAFAALGLDGDKVEGGAAAGKDAATTTPTPEAKKQATPAELIEANKRAKKQAELLRWAAGKLAAEGSPQAASMLERAEEVLHPEAKKQAHIEAQELIMRSLQVDDVPAPEANKQATPAELAQAKKQAELLRWAAGKLAAEGSPQAKLMLERAEEVQRGVGPAKLGVEAAFAAAAAKQRAGRRDTRNDIRERVQKITEGLFDAGVESPSNGSLATQDRP